MPRGQRTDLFPPVEIRIPMTTVFRGQLPHGSKIFSTTGDFIKWYIKENKAVTIYSCRKIHIETLRDVSTIYSIDKSELKRLLRALK